MFRILDSLLSLYRRARFPDEIWWEGRAPLAFAISVVAYLLWRAGGTPWLAGFRFEDFKDVFIGVLGLFAIAIAFNLAVLTIMAAAGPETVIGRAKGDIVKGILQNGLTWGQFVNMRLTVSTVYGSIAIAASIFGLLLLALKREWSLPTGWLELIYIGVLIWSTTKALVMTGKNVMYMFLLLTPSQRPDNS